MDPEKLHAIIREFCEVLGKNFEVGPTALVLPPKIFTCFLIGCPELLGGDGNNITWNLPLGPVTLRRG